jgi:hypothetical protein
MEMDPAAVGSIRGSRASPRTGGGSSLRLATFCGHGCPRLRSRPAEELRTAMSAVAFPRARAGWRAHSKLWNSLQPRRSAIPDCGTASRPGESPFQTVEWLPALAKTHSRPGNASPPRRIPVPGGGMAFRLGESPFQMVERLPAPKTAFSGIGTRFSGLHRGGAPPLSFHSVHCGAERQKQGVRSLNPAANPLTHPAK